MVVVKTTGQGQGAEHAPPKVRSPPKLPAFSLVRAGTWLQPAVCRQNLALWERDLGLRDANRSASAHRTKEAKTEIWLCTEGGLTVEQGGAGPVVAPGGAVR